MENFKYSRQLIIFVCSPGSAFLPPQATVAPPRQALHLAGQTLRSGKPGRRAERLVRGCRQQRWPQLRQ